MKIAIIGSGISGLTCAHLLHKDFDIQIFEANDYVGGHTHTVDINRQKNSYAVDTGFIVFNTTTYPNFSALLNLIGVSSQPTFMNFSVRCERTGLEYASGSANSMFAQRKNLFSLPFWRMIFEIFKLRRKLVDFLASNRMDMSMDEFLARHNFSKRFIDHFVVPLGASLWSAEPGKINEFPVHTFGRFFENHGFLRSKNPIEWRVISGGSKRYVEKLTEPFAEKIFLKTPVSHVQRDTKHVKISFPNRSTEQFDQVIFATHSDQALALLDSPTKDEYKILGDIPYTGNETILHTDTDLLPMNKKIWSSWNYFIQAEENNRAAVTYDMNKLQDIKAHETFCVSLNMEHKIAPKKVINRFLYQHPVYTERSVKAQKSHAVISGQNHTHYCGAYWGYGFHEDGVKSALAVCKYFGKSL